MYSVLKRLLVGRPLPSAELHRGVLEAPSYARSLAPNHLVAVTVVSDEVEQVRIEEQWEGPRLDMPLDIISGEG